MHISTEIRKNNHIKNQKLLKKISMLEVKIRKLEKLMKKLENCHNCNDYITCIGDRLKKEVCKDNHYIYWKERK